MSRNMTEYSFHNGSIGSGYYAKVYLGRHIASNRPVAIKILNSERYWKYQR